MAGAPAAMAMRPSVTWQCATSGRMPSCPPARIVPMLADEGLYLASESTFSRVLRAHGQTVHRGRAKAPRAVRRPTTHIAAAPRAVWCWHGSKARLVGHAQQFSTLGVALGTGRTACGLPSPAMSPSWAFQRCSVRTSGE